MISTSIKWIFYVTTAAIMAVGAWTTKTTVDTRIKVEVIEARYMDIVARLDRIESKLDQSLQLRRQMGALAR